MGLYEEIGHDLVTSEPDILYEEYDSASVASVIGSSSKQGPASDDTYYSKDYETPSSGTAQLSRASRKSASKQRHSLKEGRPAAKRQQLKDNAAAQGSGAVIDSNRESTTQGTFYAAHRAVKAATSSTDEAAKMSHSAEVNKTGKLEQLREPYIELREPDSKYTILIPFEELHKLANNGNEGFLPETTELKPQVHSIPEVEISAASQTTK